MVSINYLLWVWTQGHAAEQYFQYAWLSKPSIMSKSNASQIHEDVMSTAENEQQSGDHSVEGDNDQGMLSDTGKKYHL